MAAEHLPNAVRIHARVISGGQPDGEAGFRELQQLGVKTIISVDGAKPDVALAAKYGLRYVHLPHGYDGIPDQRVQELAKAVRDLEGPIYIHCHHGKHRSPAAAGAACVTAGFLAPEHALAVLEVAGTSKNYRGLFDAVRAARPLEPALLDSLTVEFREAVALPPLAEAMVAMEHVFDRLKECAAAGWKAPERHPDLDPPHEALLLREHFTELLRAEEVQSEPAEFQELLRAGEQAAQQLETALRGWQPSVEPDPKSTIEPAFMRVTENCKSCHERFRDVPLSEKQVK